MIDPRASLHTLRLDSWLSHDDSHQNSQSNSPDQNPSQHQHHHHHHQHNNSISSLVFEIEEPERPIHPALEYETVVQADDVAFLMLSQRDSDGRRRRRNRNRRRQRQQRRPSQEQQEGDDDSDNNDEDEDDEDDQSDQPNAVGRCNASRMDGELDSLSSSMMSLPTRHCGSYFQRCWGWSTMTSTDWKQYISFLALVLFGTGNAVAAKLQTIPMYNYPNFLNLFATLMYIPVSFAYVALFSKYRVLFRGTSSLTTSTTVEIDEHRRPPTTRQNWQNHQPWRWRWWRSRRVDAPPLGDSLDTPIFIPEGFGTNDNNDDALEDFPVVFWDATSRDHSTQPILGRDESLAAATSPPSLSLSPLQQSAPLSPSRAPSPPYAWMGLLDCLAASMQVFSSIYLPGPLLVLLPQVAIPCCMVLSRYLLQERYRWTQYLGAGIVLVGILLVWEPVVTGHRNVHDYYCEARNVQQDCTICQAELSQDACLSHYEEKDRENSSSSSSSHVVWMLWSNGTTDPDDGNHPSLEHLCQWLPYEQAVREEELLIYAWSFVAVASAIPLTLSAIFKQRTLSLDRDLDPIYLNGRIAVYQFVFSALIAIPAGMIATPYVAPWDVPVNIWNGILCFTGHHGTIQSGCHPDSLCSSYYPALLVGLYLFCNVGYTLSLILVLKYGSSSALLFLALTMIVPSSNLAFALMPEYALSTSTTVMYRSDIFGLVIILTGLICYRFAGNPLPKKRQQQQQHQDLNHVMNEDPIEDDNDNDMIHRTGMGVMVEVDQYNTDMTNQTILLARYGEDLHPRLVGWIESVTDEIRAWPYHWWQFLREPSHVDFMTSSSSTTTTSATGAGTTNAAVLLQEPLIERGDV